MHRFNDHHHSLKTKSVMNLKMFEFFKKLLKSCSCVILIYLIHQFMMKVGHLQFSEASGGFPNVSRTEVLLEQENNLFNQVLNRPETSPNTPNIVQPHQAMLNAQQCVWNWKIKTISWKNWQKTIEFDGVLFVKKKNNYRHGTRIFRPILCPRGLYTTVWTWEGYNRRLWLAP